MNDAELIALAALARAEIESRVAENAFRAANQAAPAYLAMDTGPACEALERELRRRGVLS